MKDSDVILVNELWFPERFPGLPLSAFAQYSKGIKVQSIGGAHDCIREVSESRVMVGQ